MVNKLIPVNMFIRIKKLGWGSEIFIRIKKLNWCSTLVSYYKYKADPSLVCLSSHSKLIRSNNHRLNSLNVKMRTNQYKSCLGPHSNCSDRLCYKLIEPVKLREMRG